MKNPDLFSRFAQPHQAVVNRKTRTRSCVEGLLLTSIAKIVQGSNWHDLTGSSVHFGEPEASCSLRA